MYTSTKFLIAAAVLVSLCLSADPPNWLGTFTIDKSCDQSACCCVDEQATITKASDTLLLISAQVAGVPCREQLNGSTSIAVELPIPTDKNGFQITTNFLGTDNRFTLTADSQSIANVNLQYPKCSGLGQRVTPNWLGTFDVDDSCNQNECCCPTERAAITQLNATHYLVAAKVAGAPCQAQLNGSTSVEVALRIPQDKQGFQITTNFLGTNNRFTLNYDSQSIANVNLDSPKCSGMAQRSENKPSAACIRSSSSFFLSFSFIIILLLLSDVICV